MQVQVRVWVQVRVRGSGLARVLGQAPVRAVATRQAAARAPALAQVQQQ